MAREQRRFSRRPCAVRLSLALAERLEAEATRLGLSKSAVLRRWLERGAAH